MYAGTWNDDGAQVWRTTDGRSWGQFTPSWSISTTAVCDAQRFGGRLYVGTESIADGGEMWRTEGTAWERVASAGLGDINNYAFNAITVFSDTLLAATGNFVTGVEMWHSASGDAGSWQQANADGFGLGGGTGDVVLDAYGGYLYLGLGRWPPGIAEPWRMDDHTTWIPVFTDGLGNSSNTHVSAMAEFSEYFYIGLRNEATGGEVWRSNDGVSWTSVFTGGLGNAADTRPYGLITFEDKLYLVFSNLSTGAEVWQSTDGVAWHQISAGGWGDGNNIFADYFDKAAVIFNDALHIGTYNEMDGGEIWLMLDQQVYLPLVLRN
jgi:hypothetical protein